MAKYIVNEGGRKVGVRLSIREYNEIRLTVEHLRVQVDIQGEILRRKQAVMIAPPTTAGSIWHPN